MNVSYTAFKNATQTNDAYLIREIVSSLKDVKVPKLLPILSDLLSVGDDYTKRDVIQVLGKNGDAEDLKILESYCTDKSYSISYAAKQAMASLKRSLQKIPELRKKSKKDPETEGSDEENCCEKPQKEKSFWG